MLTPSSFFEHTSFFLLKEFSLLFFFLFLSSLHRRHGSICNLAIGFSPTHPTFFDPYFDHDYFFKSLYRERDAQSSARVLLAPCPFRAVPRTTALNDCEYSQHFRHIQNNLIRHPAPNRHLGMLLCRRIARRL